MNVDWNALSRDLWEHGFAVARRSLDPSACDDLVAHYDDDARYRKTVTMQAHGFGRGQYRYFAYPLPAAVASLRSSLYAALAPIANHWNEALSQTDRYPDSLEAYLARCEGSGQQRPTPLILTYGPGDFNCLHQDLYGELAFPLQATVALSGRSEYEGGESVFVMQRPRAQSRAAVVTLERGDLLVFPNRYRPVQSSRGFARENVRHGVSEVRAGRRFALGVIFHDAR